MPNTTPPKPTIREKKIRRFDVKSLDLKIRNGKLVGIGDKDGYYFIYGNETL